MMFVVTFGGVFVNVVHIREKNLAKAASYLPEEALKALVLSALSISCDGYGAHEIAEIKPVTI